MSVWKSDEKLLIFASFISPSKIILFDKKYQAFDAVSSQDETPQSSSKIPRCPSYFQLSSPCFIWWWHTASNASYITLTNLITSKWTNKDHRLIKITATDIIIRQKATFAHNWLFYDNDLFHTHRLSPPSDETIFIFRNLHSAMVFLVFQVQMEYLEYPGLPDRKDPREGNVWKDK